ncbi:MAG: type pilus assembly protein PilA [Candidatus Sumerlaeota bacterium]|nr:type pilus assembly protein PilA [Candidatus Sumerlaeota bacterium]
MIRTKKGFTLVEIMIVVAIIGILIAIAVPGFLKARETSRKNACQENQSKIDGAVQQYILEENLEDQAAAVTELGGIAALVGEGEYLRVTPECPSSGTYTLNGTGPAVTCSIDDHPYPGTES